MCEITLGEEPFGIYPNESRGGLHFGSSTMYGDGVYNIFGIFINDSIRNYDLDKFSKLGQIHVKILSDF